MRLDSPAATGQTQGTGTNRDPTRRRLGVFCLLHRIPVGTRGVKGWKKEKEEVHGRKGG